MENVLSVVFAIVLPLMFIGWVWTVVRGFKKALGWGCTMLTTTGLLFLGGTFLANVVSAALCVLSVPGFGLAHVLRHDGDGKVPFLLTLPGTLAIFILATLNMTGVIEAS